MTSTMYPKGVPVAALVPDDSPLQQVEDAVAQVDDAVARWASEHATPWSTDVLRGITHLGDTVTIVAIVAVAAVLLLVARRPRWALFLLLVAAGQSILTNAVKHGVGRPRPDLDQLVPAGGYSFPSGHSSGAAATYLALALVAGAWLASTGRRGATLRIVPAAVAVAVALAVAASRVLLGVHWLTDAVAGLLLGWAWCLLCAWALGLLPSAPRGGIRTPPPPPPPRQPPPQQPQQPRPQAPPSP